jgi:molybdate transport system substrate-binding protein
VKVAVAANFTEAMRAIARDFEQAAGHRVLISFGSTGKLYTQIINGAPFEVFLAADQQRPERLVQAGKAWDRFTYASGRLVLWSADAGTVDPDGRVLGSGAFDRLAVANPRTAPYGSAAMQVLDRLGLSTGLRGKLVRGESIGQTYQFVASGAARLGFVALAQVTPNPGGSRWLVPRELYTPIRQDAVLLEAGRDRPAARALMDFLRGPAARSVIERFGYSLDQTNSPPQ